MSAGELLLVRPLARGERGDVTDEDIARVAHALNRAYCVGDDLFQSDAVGARARARFESDLRAAGIEDAEAANVSSVFEGGSLVHVM